MGKHDEPLWRRAATHTLHTSLLLKGMLEDALIERAGLLFADNEALANLVEGEMTMSEIADSLILSRGGTTKVVDRLEEMGYVERRPNAEDRRATIVTVTQAGREARARARVVIDAELEDMWARHISDEEAAILIDVADRVLHARNRSLDA
jgi:DNA-binding MarR family transcriptional regulator